MTVLVVEPDGVMRQFLRRLLERHGFDVLLSASTEQALRILVQPEVALHVIVHDQALLHGDERRVVARLASVEPPHPVVTYGGDSPNGPSGAPGPFDGERLVRAVVEAARATG